MEDNVTEPVLTDQIHEPGTFIIISFNVLNILQYSILVKSVLKVNDTYITDTIDTKQ